MSSEQLGSLLPLVLIVAAAYFLLIRPARKRAQAVNSLQRSLAVGAEVMLTSGIFGTVTSIDDDRIQVDVAEGVVLTVHRGAIAKVISEVPSDTDYEDQPADYEDQPADYEDQPADYEDQPADDGQPDEAAQDVPPEPDPGSEPDSRGAR